MKRLEDAVRAGESPEDLTLLIRGGTDTKEKLVQHADRMSDRFTYQGLAARGISLFAARGDLDERAVLATRLITYRRYYKVAPAQLATVGRLLPTFAAPHWTLLFEPAQSVPPRPLADLVEEFLAILGPLLDNPKYVPPEAHRR
ncbi:MAG: hypothetical protein QM572_11960 [Nocardioides sp.]|uniref:hypothetical protein n=1 Tax=Nocardioides sp. TaxID=35761 RepID=UPI0039E2EBAA